MEPIFLKEVQQMQLSYFGLYEMSGQEGFLYMIRLVYFPFGKAPLH